jgi:hypothetical protein
MTTILLIEKTGVIKELSVKSLNTEELYKKAGFKINTGFKCFANWKPIIDGIPYNVYLYGKINGKAGQENKFDYPPPVDNVLFFGSCILLLKDPNNGNYIDFKQHLWNKIYDYLFEEFENIENEEEDDEEEEEEEVDDENLTQQGYVKDGFIVEDDDEGEEESAEEAEQEEDEEVDEEEDDEASFDEPKKKSNNKKKAKKEKNIKKNKKEEKTINYLNCCNELEKEEYI